MKYHVYVKEIWVQRYTVEANSKAHAKTQLIQASQSSLQTMKPDSTPPQRWGVVSGETWEVEEA